MSSSATKFILTHPKNVTKIVKPSSTKQNISISTSRKKISQISLEQEQQIITKIKQKQQSRLNQLKKQLKQKIQQNKLYSQSLSFYSPDDQLNTLQQEVNRILGQHKEINEQILNCQIVQKNTTPQEYYLFKKKQRMDSFNQSIDNLYNTLSESKNKYNVFMNNCKQQMSQLNEQIKNLKENINKPQRIIASKRPYQKNKLNPSFLNQNSDLKSQRKKSKQAQNSFIQEMNINDDLEESQKEQSLKVQQKKTAFSLFQMPKLQFSLRDNVFTKEDQLNEKQESLLNKEQNSPNFKKKLEGSANKLKNMKVPMAQSINHNFQKQKQIQQQESPSESSIDQEEYYLLKQQYTNILSTVEILSQNKEILTVQLYDRVINLNESLNNFFQQERTKIFKQIKDIKSQINDPKKISSSISSGVVQPSQIQMAYNIKPLIQDYVNKMLEIGKKLTPQLREVSKQLLIPLKWQTLNIESYFQNQEKSSKQSTLSKEEEILKLQEKSKKIQQQIKEYEYYLTQVNRETIAYKQQHHQLQQAMNNMRRSLQQIQL